jgi:hypothetical protein
MSALGMASLGVLCNDRALGLASLGVFCTPETTGGGSSKRRTTNLQRNVDALHMKRLVREDEELTAIVIAIFESGILR